MKKKKSTTSESQEPKACRAFRFFPFIWSQNTRQHTFSNGPNDHEIAKALLDIPNLNKHDRTPNPVDIFSSVMNMILTELLQSIIIPETKTSPTEGDYI